MEEKSASVFVIDTSALTQAVRSYYAHDICPGFWDCLAYHVQEGRIVIVDKVKKEIVDGTGPPQDWLRDDIDRTHIASTKEESVAILYGQLINWVQGNPQFMETAKAEFASVADGWVIAYAKSKGLAVVSQETYAAEIRKRVPIPNVCRQFDIPHYDLFQLLRTLGARFDWTTP